jgi:acyl-CoA thioester hydrolase
VVRGGAGGVYPAENALIAVVEVTARYKAPARYDEELIVRTTMAGVRGPIVRFRYAVVRAEDDVVLCEGETTHIVVGRDMKRREMPIRYAEKFAAVVHRMVKA